MKRLAATLALLGPIAGLAFAPAGPDDPTVRASAAELIAGLRAAGNGDLADQVRARLERSAGEVAARRAGHTIFGRVSVLGPDDPERVEAQMRILDDGYFVGTVGQAGKPVGFRLHGYEPVDIIPAGEPGSVENVGLVVLAPLREASRASLSGVVALEGQPDATAASARLSIQVGPINNLTGGYEGNRGIPLPPVVITPEGELSAAGLVPTRHHLNVMAPGYWVDSRTVDLRPGLALDLGTIKLERSDQVTVATMVAAGPSFAAATASTQTTAGSDGWRVKGGDRDTDFLLFLFRPDGREVRIRSSHGPFELADLGEGTIEEQAKLDHSKVRLNSGASVLARSGHVYLGRWGFAGEWVLFRIEMRKMTGAEAKPPASGRP